MYLISYLIHNISELPIISSLLTTCLAVLLDTIITNAKHVVNNISFLLTKRTSELLICNNFNISFYKIKLFHS